MHWSSSGQCICDSRGQQFSRQQSGRGLLGFAVSAGPAVHNPMATSAFARTVEQRRFHLELLVDQVQENQKDDRDQRVVSGASVVDCVKDENRTAECVERDHPPFVSPERIPLNLCIHFVGDMRFEQFRLLPFDLGDLIGMNRGQQPLHAVEHPKRIVEIEVLLVGPAVPDFP